MASNLLSRMALAIRAGFQFGGQRKLYDVFGYPATLTTTHLLAKYQRQDIVTRVVDMAPEEMWSKPPSMADLHGSKKKWDEFVAKVGLWDRVIQADKLCNFGSFTVMWLGLPGSQNLPAPVVRDVSDILYLQSYGGDNVKIKQFEDNTKNARYGQPLLYEVNVGTQNQPKKIEVHFSRVVHIVDRPLQGLMFSEPRLAVIYNVLDDILKVAGGSAETYWLTSNRGMQVDIDKDMELQAGDAEALEDELTEFQHQLRRYIRTRGVKITTLGSEVADPQGVFNTLISILAGTTSIPQRILMGSEAGQLASEQDRANWAEYLERRRKVFGEPYVLKPILRKLEDIRFLPEGATDKATFEWPEAFHMSPLEESNTLAGRARAVVNLSRRAQFGNPLITDEEARMMVGLPSEVPTEGTMPKPLPEKSNNPGSGPGKQDGASQTEAPAAVATPAATD